MRNWALESFVLDPSLYFLVFLFLRPWGKPYSGHETLQVNSTPLARVDPGMENVDLIKRFPMREVVLVEMAVHASDRVVTRQDDAKLALFFKISPLCKEELDQVVTRHVLLTVPDDAQKDVIQHWRERGFQIGRAPCR